MQPIIRGIQAVGAVDIFYKYMGNGGKLSAKHIQGGQLEVNTGNRVSVAGFRLDGEFLRAMQQIASSATIPILGGGGVSLTNNNRTGTLSLTCTKVSTPAENGSMAVGGGVGPKDAEAYDMVLLAQLQQGQEGGDSCGAQIDVEFYFSGKKTTVTFEGCTVASVDPLGLAGNDAVNYNVVFNYLNWYVQFELGTAFTPSTNNG